MQTIMVFHASANKNADDPIENQRARVLTTLNIIFSNIPGQLTLQSVVKSGRNSNSFEILFMVVLVTVKTDED